MTYRRSLFRDWCSKSVSRLVRRIPTQRKVNLSSKQEVEQTMVDRLIHLCNNLPLRPTPFLLTEVTASLMAFLSWEMSPLKTRKNPPKSSYFYITKPPFLFINHTSSLQTTLPLSLYSSTWQESPQSGQEHWHIWTRKTFNNQPESVPMSTHAMTGCKGRKCLPTWTPPWLRLPVRAQFRPLEWGSRYACLHTVTGRGSKPKKDKNKQGSAVKSPTCVQTRTCNLRERRLTGPWSWSYGSGHAVMRREQLYYIWKRLYYLFSAQKYTTVQLIAIYSS